LFKTPDVTDPETLDVSLWDNKAAKTPPKFIRDSLVEMDPAWRRRFS
jgi:hypothetical protein